MSKSKIRILKKNSGIGGAALKRNEAVIIVLKNIKQNKQLNETEKLIGLFGITVEELLEAGAEYEEISAIKYMFI